MELMCEAGRLEPSIEGWGTIIEEGALMLSRQLAAFVGLFRLRRQWMSNAGEDSSHTQVKIEESFDPARTKMWSSCFVARVIRWLCQA